jgi:hypothetical protein
MFNRHINKFFEVDAPETVSTTTQPTIAELMATHGVKNTTENPVAMPISPISEKQQEPPQANQEPPAATAIVPNAETVTQESPTPEVETVIEQTPPIAEVQPPVKSWQEVLKEQPDTDVLKTLGYNDSTISFVKELKEIDPKMVAFFNTWKEGGDVTSYLKELSTDYTKMPAEEVMRHQLRQEYPTLSEKHLQVLFEDEVAEKFKLDPERYSEEEVERGKLLLEAKAERYRTQLIQNQQNFLLPKPPEPKQAEPDPQEAAAKQAFESYKQTVTENPVTKNIVAQKSISIGEGDDKFNFPVDPDGLTKVLFDESKWQETQFDIVRNPDGSVKSYTPKTEHQLLVAAVAVHGKKIFDDYAKHLKALGSKAVIDPIENAKPPEQNNATPAQVAPQSAAEAMARQGRLV